MLRLTLILLGALTSSGQLIGAEPEHPNILWISCEDISPQLGCYGDPDARTPRLDALAASGTRFSRAYTCHGVCAPSRTGIITGMFPISLGANHMRSKVQIPRPVRLFPQLLRDAGYYCTNNSKTDYNLDWDAKAVWDASSNTAHWKNRKTPDQPFFAVFNLTMTHESKVWPSGWEEVVRDLPADQRHQADKVSVPPLYPDTPAVRSDFARLADLITVMDAKAGRLLDELEQAGLSESTIVFFWSDHGNGLPRAKRWTYESGSRVPLIVRVPERFREAAGMGTPGSVDDRLTQLIDLGPTVLSLAGVAQPDWMQGRAINGPERKNGCRVIYGARDRLDERMDMVRTVRDERFRYVRNLMPWRPALQHVSYGEQNETLREIRRLLAEGTLPPASAQWFDVPRPSEELYDVIADPWELRNLAAEPAFQDDLRRLRQQCDDWQIESPDVHLIPEVLFADSDARGEARTQQLAGPDGSGRVRRLLAAAVAASSLDETVASRFEQSLAADPAERWWQVSLIAQAPHPEDRLETLLRESRHAEVAIRIAAAGGLARAGRPDEAATALAAALQDSREPVRHTAMLQIDEAGPDVISRLRSRIEDVENSEYVNRLKEHALAQIPD